MCVCVCVCVRACVGLGFGILSEIARLDRIIWKGVGHVDITAACWAIRIAAVAAFMIQIDPARFRRVHDKQAQGRSSCRCPSRVPHPRQQAQPELQEQPKSNSPFRASIDRHRTSPVRGQARPKRSWRRRALDVCGWLACGWMCVWTGRTRVRSITNHQGSISCLKVENSRGPRHHLKEIFHMGSLVGIKFY